jgi:putative ABC transport system substrate-binding protein
MIDRRACIGAALATLAKPFAAGARSASRLPRIGVLSFGTAPAGDAPDPAKGFAQGLSELGYVEGLNIVVERRYANDQQDRLAALAAELVRPKVDVILAGGPATREAARMATRTIPIVTVSGSDPVQEGWVQSLAHPGGNVTGLTVTFPELSSKSLELLKQAFPEVSCVALLRDPAEVPDAMIERTQAGARRLGIQIEVLDVGGPSDFDAAFGLARQRRAQALFAVATNLAVAHRARLAARATSEELLSVSEFPLMTQAGFPMTYGADLEDLRRRSVAQMDRILKGASAGDLPIERPTKFQWIVNLKTAKAIGITVPQSLLLRADEVIQ